MHAMAADKTHALVKAKVRHSLHGYNTSMQTHTGSIEVSLQICDNILQEKARQSTAHTPIMSAWACYFL
jgi:hypothetical protein